MDIPSNTSTKVCFMRYLLFLLLFSFAICVRAQDATPEAPQGDWEVEMVVEGQLITVTTDGITEQRELPEGLQDGLSYALSADRRWLAVTLDDFWTTPEDVREIQIVDLSTGSCCQILTDPNAFDVGFEGERFNVIGFLPDEPNTLLLVVEDDCWLPCSRRNRLVALDVERNITLLGAGDLLGYGYRGVLTAQGVEVQPTALFATFNDIDTDWSLPLQILTYDVFTGELLSQRSSLHHWGSYQGALLPLTGEYVGIDVIPDEDESPTWWRWELGYVAAGSGEVVWITLPDDVQRSYASSDPRERPTTTWVMDGNAILIYIPLEDVFLALRDGSLHEISSYRNRVEECIYPIAGTLDGWLAWDSERGESIIWHCTFHQDQVLFRELGRLPQITHGSRYEPFFLAATPLGATASGAFPTVELMTN